jgi:hypothetical protein
MPSALTARYFATILNDMETEDRPPTSEQSDDGRPVAPCPVCGFTMVAIRGSKDAVCGNCGFKDSCCY